MTKALYNEPRGGKFAFRQSEIYIYVFRGQQRVTWGFLFRGYEAVEKKIKKHPYGIGFPSRSTAEQGYRQYLMHGEIWKCA